MKVLHHIKCTCGTIRLSLKEGFSVVPRHVPRRGQTVSAAIQVWHGAAVRRRAHQLAGAGGGLRGAGALRGRGVHRGGRAAHLRRHVLLAAVARAAAAQRPRLARHASGKPTTITLTLNQQPLRVHSRLVE